MNGGMGNSVVSENHFSGKTYFYTIASRPRTGARRPRSRPSQSPARQAFTREALYSDAGSLFFLNVVVFYTQCCLLAVLIGSLMLGNVWVYGQLIFANKSDEQKPKHWLT